MSLRPLSFSIAPITAFVSRVSFGAPSIAFSRCFSDASGLRAALIYMHGLRRYLSAQSCSKAPAARSSTLGAQVHSSSLFQHRHFYRSTVTARRRTLVARPQRLFIRVVGGDVVSTIIRSSLAALRGQARSTTA